MGWGLPLSSGPAAGLADWPFAHMGAVQDLLFGFARTSVKGQPWQVLICCSNECVSSSRQNYKFD